MLQRLECSCLPVWLADTGFSVGCHLPVPGWAIYEQLACLMLSALLVLVFLWKLSHMFPSWYGEKHLKGVGRMRQTHMLYPLWSCPPLGFLVPWICLWDQVGFYTYGIFLCIGMHAFLGIGLLFKFTSPPFTQVQLHKMQIFFKAMLLIFSKFRPSYTMVQNLFSVLSPGRAHIVSFTCAVSGMLLVKM